MLHCSYIYIAIVKIPSYFIIINSQITQIPQLWLLLANSTTAVRNITQPRKHFYLQILLPAKELDKRLVFQQHICQLKHTSHFYTWCFRSMKPVRVKTAFHTIRSSPILCAGERQVQLQAHRHCHTGTPELGVFF